MGLIQKGIVVLIVLILLGGFMIVKTQEIDLKEASGVITLAKAYVVWTGSVIKNVGVLTANVISMDWLPGS